MKSGSWPPKRTSLPTLKTPVDPTGLSKISPRLDRERIYAPLVDSPIQLASPTRERWAALRNRNPERIATLCVPRVPDRVRVRKCLVSRCQNATVKPQRLHRRRREPTINFRVGSMLRTATRDLVYVRHERSPFRHVTIGSSQFAAAVNLSRHDLQLSRANRGKVLSGYGPTSAWVFEPLKSVSGPRPCQPSHRPTSRRDFDGATHAAEIHLRTEIST